MARNGSTGTNDEKFPMTARHSTPGEVSCVQKLVNRRGLDSLLLTPVAVPNWPVGGGFQIKCPARRA